MDIWYPYHLIWTTIPAISWIIPFMGHLGITDSNGNIYDFAGDYNIQKNNFAFGEPIIVYPVPSMYLQTECTLDKGIILASERYKTKKHSLITNNCHHFCLDCIQIDKSMIYLVTNIMLYGVYLNGWKGRLRHLGPFVITWSVLSAAIVSLVLLA